MYELVYTQCIRVLHSLSNEISNATSRSPLSPWLGAMFVFKSSQQLHILMCPQKRQSYIIEPKYLIQITASLSRTLHDRARKSALRQQITFKKTECIFDTMIPLITLNISLFVLTFYAPVNNFQ